MQHPCKNKLCNNRPLVSFLNISISVSQLPEGVRFMMKGETRGLSSPHFRGSAFPARINMLVFVFAFWPQMDDKRLQGGDPAGGASGTACLGISWRLGTRDAERWTVLENSWGSFSVLCFVNETELMKAQEL